jgi:hypothetical protein
MLQWVRGRLASCVADVVVPVAAKLIPPPMRRASTTLLVGRDRNMSSCAETCRGCRAPTLPAPKTRIAPNDTLAATVGPAFDSALVDAVARTEDPRTSSPQVSAHDGGTVSSAAAYASPTSPSRTHSTCSDSSDLHQHMVTRTLSQPWGGNCRMLRARGSGARRSRIRQAWSGSSCDCVLLRPLSVRDLIQPDGTASHQRFRGTLGTNRARLVERSVAAGHRPGWVAADEIHGNDPTLRVGLERHRIGYVLATSLDADVDWTCQDPSGRAGPGAA